MSERSDRPPIPYERQEEPETNRMCGAAALSMAYRSLGKSARQTEIWPKISKHNRFGSLASTTHLMVRDALGRGFAALAIQAKHPLQTLRLCRDNGIRAVLSHRLKRDSPTGHYTVLVDIDAEAVVLHDPFFGPSRRVSHAELLELWQPRFENAEIAGNMLIGVVAEPAPAPACAVCRKTIPPTLRCPNCSEPVALEPAELLGCVAPGCAGRMWNYICCPSCDFTWTFSVQPVESEAAASASPTDPWNLGKLFGELDKFCAWAMSSPAAATHPDVVRNMALMQDAREKLKLAQSEYLVNRDAQQAKLDQIQQKYRQEENALLEKKNELKDASPSLDGTALGQALLKNLGLLG